MSLLIVHRDPYMAEELEAFSRGLIDLDLHPARPCPDMATARAELTGAEPPKLLVVEIDLPDGGRHAGLALVREMRARWTEGQAVPALILAPAADAALSREVSQLPACSLVCEGSHLERDFQYALRCLLAEVEGRATPAVPRAPSYYIRFRVDAQGNCDYEVRSVKTMVSLDSHVRFGIDPGRLQKLLDQLPQMPEGQAPPLEQWIQMYQTAGEELTRALFREQVDVSQEFGMLLGLLRAAPQTKVGLCFSVDKAFYRIPFEALRLPVRGDARYWMEERPLWRSLPEYPMSRPMLFSADEVEPSEPQQQPVNCLLINARCGGLASLPPMGAGGRESVLLSAIPNADDEIAEIEQVLVNAIPARVGRVVTLHMDKRGDVVTSSWDPQGRHHVKVSRAGFDEVLEQVLTQQGPWQLVHFTGHSHFVGPEGAGVGYVFVPVAAGTNVMPTPRPVSIGKLASWLTDARFAFLSGCSSSHRDFVYQLCARDVPALSGYPWPVLDGIAWRHSAHFYRRLLQSCSIEEALQKSWFDMYSEHREHWAWASSQFVIQSMP